MDILIKNMEMPKGNNVLVVDSAGTITKVNRWTGKVEATDPFSVKAIELPEHGDLKDETDIIHRIEKIAYADLAQDIIGEILALPTIVEATE